MNWFKNLKTGSKLLVGFGTMIVLLGVIMGNIFLPLEEFSNVRH